MSPSLTFSVHSHVIVLQFEEYICAALATIKYTGFLAKNASGGVLISEGYGSTFRTFAFAVV